MSPKELEGELQSELPGGPSGAAKVPSKIQKSGEASVLPLFSFAVLTLFPEMLQSFLSSSLMGKALKNGLLTIDLHQMRDYSQDKHHTVDDTPYGGGEGMLLKVDVLHRAWMGALKKTFGIEATRKEDLAASGVRTILLTPQGRVLTQEFAKELVAGGQKLVLVCGHYEGIDERFIDLCVDQELSIGDYVLTGGEIPAAVLMDTLSRLVPGVVGNADSVARDSLEGGLLKFPQYTRPREYEGSVVPDVLLSGNHREILKWREQQSVERTKRKRV